MSVCVISQPRFFPGLHYLHRMMAADVFVIFDTIRFNPRHEENRTKLKSPNGKLWLTVPTDKTNGDQTICKIRVKADQQWIRKSVKTLYTFYGKAPHFTSYGPQIVSILESPHESLSRLNRESWEPALRLLGITCKFVYASEIPVSGRGTRLLLDICRYLGADTYLSGAFGRDYLDVREFVNEGIKVRFHEYSYPDYPQCFGNYVPFLSYLDMLFNVGLERDMVAAGGKMLLPD